MMLLIFIFIIFILICIIYNCKPNEYFIRTAPPQKDILDYIAPLVPPSPVIPITNKYIIFQLDCGGLNNIRMQYELLVCLCWLSGRTLVLTPPKKIPHMDSVIDMSEIWDFDSLASTIPVKPAENLEYRKFFRNVEEGVYGTVYEPEWSPYTHSRFDKKWMDTPAARTSDIWYFYCDRINKISNNEFRKHRMLGNIDCYFDNLSNLEKKKLRGVVFSALKYNRKYFEEAKKQLNHLGLRPGHFNAIHIRNWEAQYKTSTSEDILSSMNINFEKNTPVFLLRWDVVKKEYIRDDVIEKQYNIVYPPMLKDSYEQAIVESLICVCARKFVGSPLSTFSTNIINMRGYVSRFTKLVNPNIRFTNGRTYEKCNNQGGFHVASEKRWNIFD